jgi:hypothetical protein
MKDAFTNLQNDYMICKKEGFSFKNPVKRIEKAPQHCPSLSRFLIEKRLITNKRKVLSETHNVFFVTSKTLEKYE